MNKEKKIKKNEHSFREMWKTISTSMYLQQKCQKHRREKKEQNNFEEIIALALSKSDERD